MLNDSDYLEVLDEIYEMSLITRAWTQDSTINIQNIANGLNQIQTQNDLLLLLQSNGVTNGNAYWNHCENAIFAMEALFDKNPGLSTDTATLGMLFSAERIRRMPPNMDETGGMPNHPCTIQYVAEKKKCDEDYGLTCGAALTTSIAAGAATVPFSFLTAGVTLATGWIVAEWNYLNCIETANRKKEDCFANAPE